MSGVDEVVRNHTNQLGVIPNREALIAALVEREDRIADFLRLTAQTFGLYPFVVAEVIASTGLGTLPTEEERELIRQQYLAGMRELWSSQGGRGEPPLPPMPEV